MCQKGFTLIEVIITIALVAMMFTLSGYAVSVASSRFAERSTDIKIHDALSTAARLARAGEHDSAWGVYFDYDEASRRAESVTLFAGDTYATRDTELDIVQPIQNYIRFTDVSLSGAEASDGNDHEIVFAKITGDTSQYGTITVDVFAVTIVVDVAAIGFDTTQ